MVADGSETVIAKADTMGDIFFPVPWTETGARRAWLSP
jgi:hypothetical protein